MKQLQQIFLAVRQALARLLKPIRRLLGVLAQSIAQRDQLFELKEQTRRLGAASVESATYMTDELRGVEKKVSAIDERLSRLEKELTELRQLLEGGQRSGAEESSESSERRDEVIAGPPSS
jgi:predicted  nucleic acid-binding Zn-ribbon protein